MVENLTYVKGRKLNIYPGYNVTDLCAEILVDSESLDIAGDFNTEHLG